MGPCLSVASGGEGGENPGGRASYAPARKQQGAGHDSPSRSSGFPSNGSPRSARGRATEDSSTSSRKGATEGANAFPHSDERRTSVVLSNPSAQSSIRTMVSAQSSTRSLGTSSGALSRDSLSAARHGNEDSSARALQQALEAAADSAVQLHRSESMTSMDSVNSQASVTKHTDSVKKSSVKMGEVEYSQFNQYIIIKDLGRGVHARVMLALNTADNTLRAIKVTNGNAAVAETAVRKEIAVLKKLNHKNVLKLFEVIDDQNSKELFLVLEYASAGPISTRYNRSPIKEPVLLSYMRDIIQGLDYLHHVVGIAHMDLKPENLLKAADGTVKIADFGVSFIGQSNQHNSHKRIVGTPAFIAPEMLGEVGYDPYVADIWSLGICMFHMATARLPFIGKTIFQIVAMARRQELQFPQYPTLSPELEHLIRMILEVDPMKRATIPEIMAHPWITSNGQHPMPDSHAQHCAGIYVTEEEVALAVRQDPLAALLKPSFKPVHFMPGEFIMRKDESGSTMYFINSGKCEVLMDALSDDGKLSAESKADGDDVDNAGVLAVRTAGQFIGEMAVLEAIQKGTPDSVGRRTASIRARGHVDCLSVTVAEMLSALERDEGARERLLSTATFRLEQNQEIILQLAETFRVDQTEEMRKERKFAPVRTLQVLYAEDSVPTQFIVKRLMKRIGNIELTCVNDGKAAFEHCEKCAKGEMVRPDIILMDCQMPVMNGLRATMQIRALKDNAMSSVTIVAVSSGIKNLNQKECMDAGMDDYVAKPLNQETLSDVLTRNLPKELLSEDSDTGIVDFGDVVILPK